MDRLGHKLLAMSLIFLIVFIMASLPIKLASFFYRQGKRGVAFLSCIMCFGGGVFFGTYLLHMTPEVQELINKTVNKPNHIHYPIAYLIIGCGFFLMMFLEKGAVELQNWKDRTSKDTKLKAKSLDTENKVNQGPVDVISVKELPKKEQQNQAFVGSITLTESQIIKVNDSDKFDTPKIMSVTSKECNDHQKQHQHQINDIAEDAQDHTSKYSHSHGHGHSHEGGHSHAMGSAAKSIVLLLALSVDSVFEGLSLGLQKTSGGVWRMVLTILSHEIAVGFSCGLQLYKYNTVKKTLFMALIYSLMCPFGIAIGTGIMEGVGRFSNADLLHGILLGISAGVFIYVLFFEILINEMSHDTKIFNILAVLVGFGVMACLLMMHNHDHDDHDHDHDHDHEGSNHTHIH